MSKENKQSVINKMSITTTDIDGTHTRMAHPVTFEVVKKMMQFDVHIKDFDDVGSCDDKKCLLCSQLSYEAPLFYQKYM